MNATAEPLLSVEDLSIGFGGLTDAVAVTDRVSLRLFPGEIFGLVESGCGKTVTALAILRLLPQPKSRILGGRILFRGQNLTELGSEELRSIRGNRIAMIFQEPSAALDPLMTVERQLLETFEHHPFEGDRIARVQELIARVGIADPGRVLRAYPHELSGGMLQRVMIAMALLLKPDVLIADEPTTALDVTVQAQVMELLRDLMRETGTAVLLITHNMGLIAQYADRLAVMYAGRIVEESSAAEFLSDPLHPYSSGLMHAIPNLAAERSLSMHPIPGVVPVPSEYATGCRFRERCTRAFEPCDRRPELLEARPGRRTACFLYGA